MIIPLVEQYKYQFNGSSSINIIFIRRHNYHQELNSEIPLFIKQYPLYCIVILHSSSAAVSKYEKPSLFSRNKLIKSEVLNSNIIYTVQPLCTPLEQKLTKAKHLLYLYHLFRKHTILSTAAIAHLHNIRGKC